MQGETEVSGVDKLAPADALIYVREHLSTTVKRNAHRFSANWRSELKLLVEMYVLLHRTQVMEVKGREWRATTSANMETSFREQNAGFLNGMRP